MDIYGAVKQIEKILEWTNSIENNNQSFYNKSISRLEYIAGTSQKVADVVNSILGVSKQQKVGAEQSVYWKEMVIFFTKEFKELKELMKGVSSQPRVTEQVQEKPPINNDVI